MRCINKSLIQKYIDRETSVNEDSIVQNHITTCSKCIKKIDEKQKISNRIKQLINSANAEKVIVPEFIVHNRTRPLKFHFRKLFYAASAACLIITFLIIYQKPKKETIIYSYSVDNEFNANLPMSQQQMVIEIIDSDGKLTKY